MFKSKFKSRWISQVDKPKEEVALKEKMSLDDYDFEVPGHFLVLGSTGSGKTTWLREYIYYNYKKYKKIFAFCGSQGLNEDYSFLPSNQLFDPSTEEGIKMLGKIYLLQKRLVKSGKKEQICLIFDDIVGVLNTHSSDISSFFDQLISSGRHLGISCIFLTQKFTKLSPTIRDNCHYYIVLRAHMKDVLGSLFEVQNDFTDKYQFWDLYREMTKERYSSMMIQNIDPYESSIVWFKPVEEREFVISVRKSKRPKL